MQLKWTTKEKIKVTLDHFLEGFASKETIDRITDSIVEQVEDEKDSVDMVRQFHDVFQPGTAHDIPTFPQDGSRGKLRVALIQEELDELSRAIYEGDIVAILDALSDIQYVLDGTYVEYGLASVKNAAFWEVHRSNMSKADTSFETARTTMEHHRELGKTCSIKRVGEKYVCIREDGKVLKSLYYSRADLKQILDDVARDNQSRKG